MKNIKRIALAILVLTSLTWACRKIDIGYISDYISYMNPVLYLMPGTNVMTGALLEDGSTMPLHVEMGEIRNAETGKIAEDLLTLRPVATWKTLYNYKTDTTKALVEAKLEIKDKPAFELNPVSGQVSWNTNTMFAEGSKYEFDLKISNVKGEKYFPKIGQVELLPFLPVTWVAGTNLGVTNQRTNVAIYSIVEDVNLLIKGTSLVETITKISTESAPGITVIFKVFDKNGVPWNPAAGEVLRSYPGSTLPNYLDCSVGTELLADRIVYHFPVTPFPFPGALWYNKNPLCYFNIPSKAVGAIDSAGLAAGQVYNPADPHWLKFRLNHFINGPGTWEIKLYFRNVTRK